MRVKRNFCSGCKDFIKNCRCNYFFVLKGLFEPMGDEAVEGFIKIKGKIYQFNSRFEPENLLNCKQNIN